MTETLSYSSPQKFIDGNDSHSSLPSSLFSKRQQYYENESLLSTQPRTLTELIQLLYQAFETNLVDIDYIQIIMQNYKSNPKDWLQYANFKPNKYTRNLVDSGNGKFNLLLLCWAEGQGSSIHDHTNSHCIMKCLQGKLRETKYAWPEEKDQPMKVISDGDLNLNEITYINDSLGLHRVENPSHTDEAVTLHLYTPPYVHCHTYDERTGRPQDATVTFYSKYGHIIDN